MVLRQYLPAYYIDSMTRKSISMPLVSAYINLFMAILPLEATLRRNTGITCSKKRSDMLPIALSSIVISWRKCWIRMPKKEFLHSISWISFRLKEVYQLEDKKLMEVFMCQKSHNFDPFNDVFAVCMTYLGKKISVNSIDWYSCCRILKIGCNFQDLSSSFSHFWSYPQYQKMCNAFFCNDSHDNYSHLPQQIPFLHLHKNFDTWTWSWHSIVIFFQRMLWIYLLFYLRNSFTRCCA